MKGRSPQAIMCGVRRAVGIQRMHLTAPWFWAFFCNPIAFI